MEEVIFMVEESQETGYIAKGLGVSIYTQAETIEELKTFVVDAMHCHYGNDKKRIIRLHIIREEILVT